MRRLQPLALALCLAAAYPATQALPTGAQVVQGQVAIQPGLIQQGSDKAIVNWQNFSIATGETLRIQQPGVNSVLLNRVVGGDPSLILGQMQANGHVFLINPRGIVFGRGSRVDAGGLVASTLDLSDTQFLAGSYRFSAGKDAGSLQADGSINAPGGTVALVAPQLNMSGSIAARRVGLAAASTVQVDVEGDGLVLFNLRNDDNRDVALKFSGRVQAEGSAELRAQARGGAAGQVLNMDGIVQARGLRQQGGRIVIDGGTAGDTMVTGKLDASGDQGGSLTVLGQRVGLLDGARLDVSGREGGGDIQVGGGFHGEGTAHNAQRTFIGTDVELRADATEQGDGGRVAIWADQRTDMLGRVWARGGRLGGNGGFVETSGKEVLNMPRGSVDVSAPRGRAGQWLLDPYNLTITNTAGGGGDVTGPSPFEPANNSAVLDVTVLNNALAMGNVVVQTGSNGSQAGNISVDGDIHATGATSFSLIAQNAISFTANGKIRATGTALDVSLQAASVDTTLGSINTLGGKLDVTVSGTVSLGAVNSGDVTVTTSGAVSLSSVQSGKLTVDTSGGAGHVTLPSGSLGGALTVTTGGGNITQGATALSVTGAAILSSGLGQITLGNLSPTGNLDITTSSGNASLGAGSIGGQLKFSSTSGSLSQSSGFTLTGGADISTGGTVTLNDSANNLGGTLDITAAAADLRNGGGNGMTLGALNIAGTLTVRTGSGPLDLGHGNAASVDAATTAGGNIVQGATALAVGGDAILSSGAGSITLGNLSPTGKLDLATSSGNVSLGAASIGGQLKFASTSGSLGQTGALSVAGGADISTDGSVTLNNGGNNLAGALDIAAGSADLRNGGGNGMTLGALNIAGTLTVRTGSGPLDLGHGNAASVDAATTAGGNIVQGATALAVGGDAVLSSGAGSITLGNLSPTGKLDLATSSGHVSLGAASIGGQLKFASTSGSLSQTGALSVTGGANLSTGGTVTLNNTGNNLGGTLDITAASADLLNGGSNGMTLGTLNIGGVLKARTGSGQLTLGHGNAASLDVATTAGGNIVQGATALAVGGDAVLSSGAGSITLGNLSPTGKLDLTTSSGHVSLGTGSIGGQLKFASTSGSLSQTAAFNVAGGVDIQTAGTVTLGNINNNLAGTVDITAGTTDLRSAGLTLGTLNTGALTVRSGSGTLNVGHGNAASLNAATSGGNIVQGATALAIGGDAVLSSGAGHITLGNLSPTGKLDLATSSGNVSLGAASIGGQLKFASTSGSLSQTGALSATGGANLSTGGTVTLDNAANNLGGTLDITAGAADLRNGGSNGMTLGTLNVAGLLKARTGSGQLTLGQGSVGSLDAATTAGGNIVQGASLLAVGGDATLSSGAGNVTLGNLSPAGKLDITTSSGNVTLGAASIGGQLLVNSSSGSLGQTGALTVNGTTDIHVGGDVLLNAAANHWMGGVQISARSLDLSSAGNLSLTGLTLAANQALSLQAQGNLDLGASVNLDTGSANLTLASGGSFNVLGTLSGGNISLTADSGLSLGQDITASGGLKLTTHTGGITQTGGRLSVAGNTTISAGTSTILLDRSGNHFGNAVSMVGGDATLFGNSGLSLGLSNVAGNLSISTAGAITQTGALTVAGTTTLNAGSAVITLGDPLNDLQGNVTVTGTSVTLTTLHDLHLFSLTQVLPNQALVLDAGGVLYLPSGTGNIDTGTAALTLSSRNGAFATFGTLRGGNVTLRGQSVTLGHDITASGSLEVQSTAGSINQGLGSLGVAGASNFNAGSQTITLTGSSNDLRGPVTLRGGATQLRTLGALTLDQANIAGSLVVQTGGAINQTAAGLNVSGNASFNAGSAAITLDQSNNSWGASVGLNGGAAKLSGAGAIALGSVNVNSLELQANGAVSQSSALVLAGALKVNAGTATIDLSNSSNQLSGTVELSGGTTQIRTQGGLTLGPGSINGNLTARSGGLINQVAGALSVSGTASFNAGGAAITLDNVNNSWGGAVSLTGGVSQLNGSGNLALGSVAVTSLDLKTTGNVSQTSALSLSGALKVDAGSGAITLSDPANQLGGPVTLKGGATTVQTSAGLSLANLATGNLTVVAVGPLNLGQGQVAGNLSASSGNGAISQTGALNVTGAANFTSGSGNITLSNSGNQFNGALSLTGNSVTIFNQPSLNFGTLSFNSLDATSNGSIELGSGTLSGTLSAKALGGSITQIAGGLTVAGNATLQASSFINMAQPNQLNGLVNLNGATTTLSNVTPLRLGTLATGALTLNVTGTLDLGRGSIGGALTAVSTGAISQTGALSVAGLANLNAGSASISLGLAGNSFGGSVNLRGGNTTITAASGLNLGSLNVGMLTASSTGALRLGAGSVSGDLSASGSGITQAAGGLAVTGASSLSAGGGNIDLPEANAFAGAVSLSGGDATLTNAGALRLGSFAVRDLKASAGGNLDLGGGTASGELTATTRGSTISQSAPLTVTGLASFVADGSQATLVLDQPGNQLLGGIAMRGINGGSFASADISTVQDLSFSGDVKTLKLSSGGLLTLGGGHNDTLSAAAAKGILLTGPLEVTGLTTLIANGVDVPVDLATHGAANDLNRVELKATAGTSLGRVQLRDGDGARHDGLKVTGDAAQLEITSAGVLDLGGGSYASLKMDTSGSGAEIKQSGALTVSGLTTVKAGSGKVTLDRIDNQLPGVTLESAGNASLVSAGDYKVNASQVSTRLELGGPGAISLVGPLSGSGELVMSGSGQLTMTTAQTYSGGTRIKSGTVVLSGPEAQAGTGAVQLETTGQLDLRDGAVMSAELVANGGRVVNTSGAGTLAGTVTLKAPVTEFMPGAGGLTISGTIADNGAGFGLRLASSGTLTLAGSNHYSGITDIASGTLRVTGELPSTSAVQLAGGAVLSLGRDQAIGSLAGAGRVELDGFTLGTGLDGTSTSFSGSLQGSGGLTKLGSGRFTLSGSAAHTGATRVAAGELVLASSTALNDITAVSVDSGATLTVQQSLNLGSLAGAGTVDVQAALLGVGSNGSSTRWDGSIIGSGGLAKLGTGVFTLAGRNTLAGDLQAKAGTLQLEGSGVRPLAAAVVTGPVLPLSAGVSVAAGATLELLTDIDLGALSGVGQVQLNANTLGLGASGRSSRFDGVMAGTGGLTKSGIGGFTLGGANLYGGATRVSGGSLVLDAVQALASSSALVIDAPAQVQANARQTVGSLSGNGALVLNGASLAAGADGRDSRFDGVASGSGGLIKQGAGVLTLTAAQGNGGTTVIEAGTMQLSGQGALGAGEIQNQGELRLSRSDALTLDQAISGRGAVVITQGQVTLNSASNSYGGATQVQGGSLITTAAERLSDASAVQVAAGAQLQLGSNETIAALQAAGSVKLAGNLTTKAEQVYTGSLTLNGAAGQTLSGTVIDASRSSNQFGSAPLGLSGGQALVTVKEGLQLGDVSLSNGGRIEAERLALNGKLQLSGGSLALVAKAAPDDAKAVVQGTAQVPVAGQSLAIAEATVQQGSAGTITVAENARLEVQASGGGSIVLAQDANSFKGQFSALSGASFNTAWLPNAKGNQAIQSQVRISGQQVLVGGSGIEADLVYIRADQLATAGDSKLVARMPFDEIVLGKALSAPGMVLELAPGAFGTPGSFGSINGQPIRVEVGATLTGNRTTGPNAGYLSLLPKAGAQGSTAVVLVGPEVGSVPASGGPAYRFFHDGASRATEIPVVYNGVLPLTPAASGALSSINGDAEDARRARFQETVRTENVTVRLRSGVIAEVGPGRPSTQGSEGVKPPELCDPAAQPVLGCKPANP